MRVGIDWMPNAAASSGWASVSTLPKTRSGLASAAFSYTGANWRQGPHQDAQKSIRTKSCSVIVWSKFSFVSSTVVLLMVCLSS